MVLQGALEENGVRSGPGLPQALAFKHGALPTDMRLTKMIAQDTKLMQDDWDRLLIVNYWGCFTRKRCRQIWQLIKSFEALHGEGARPPERCPSFELRNLLVSKFMGCFLAPVANAIIDANGDFELSAMLTLINRCRINHVSVDRELVREAKRARRHYVAGAYGVAIKKANSRAANRIHTLRVGGVAP